MAYIPYNQQSRSVVRMPSKIDAQKKELPALPSFNVGDTIMHPTEGICIVQEIKSLKFGDPTEKLYYILHPTMEKSSSRIFMPVDRGNTTLRKLLDPNTIEQVIAESPSYYGLWVSDNKQRKEVFLKILAEGNYAKIIEMIAEIHENNEERMLQGKKPCSSDEAVLAEAEKLLHQEFSYTLKMSQEEVAAYLTQRVEERRNLIHSLKSHTSLPVLEDDAISVIPADTAAAFLADANIQDRRKKAKSAAEEVILPSTFEDDLDEDVSFVDPLDFTIEEPAKKKNKTLSAKITQTVVELSEEEKPKKTRSKSK